jgi:DNA-binding LytR/AlgR family response regulator
VLLKLGAGHERFIRLADIRAISSSENYTAVSVGADGEHLLVRRSLQAWSEQLPAAHFLRVHRQTLVNVTHARGLTRVTEDISHLTLDGLPTPVTVSQRFLPALRTHLSVK